MKTFNRIKCQNVQCDQSKKVWRAQAETASVETELVELIYTFGVMLMPLLRLFLPHLRDRSFFVTEEVDT